LIDKHFINYFNIYSKIMLITMAKARKEGKPKRNRRNLVKNLKRIANNEEVIAKMKSESVK